MIASSIRPIPTASRRGFAGFATLALTGWLALASLPIEAPAQERPEPGQAAPAQFPGHIYLSSRDRDDPLRGIVAIDTNDGTWRKIAPETDVSARVSPEGSRLAVSRDGRGVVDPGLWIYPTSGEEGAFRVFEKPGSPCWSPDSREIFLTVVPRDGPHELRRLAADGSREEKARVPSTEFILDWSPGGLLLTHSGLTRYRTNTQQPLLLMDPDGTGTRTLLAATRPVPDLGGEIMRGRFSPDGRKVLCVHFHRVDQARTIKDTALLALDVDGGAPRRFFEREADGPQARSACWSPDGRAIAVHVIERLPDDSGYNTRIEIVDLDGNVLKTIRQPESSINRVVFDWR